MGNHSASDKIAGNGLVPGKTSERVIQFTLSRTFANEDHAVFGKPAV